MKMKLMKTLTCRTPAFSLEDSLAERWDELKVKISESSPGFHQLIESLDKEDIPQITTKIGFTLWKYFSRAKFRATPFGSFSAVSLVPVTENLHTGITVSTGLHTHSFVDWSEKNSTGCARLDTANPTVQYYANTSAYRVMDEIRYVRMVDGTFEIATLGFFKELGIILELCSNFLYLQDICMEMDLKSYFTAEETTSLVGQMVSAGLLLHSCMANITGEDYFKRIKARTKAAGPTYLISTREHIAGGVDASLLNQVPQMIDFLSKILPFRQNPNLRDFIASFQQRFPGQQVPLSLLMDPETGIGYGNLEQGGQSPVIESLKRQLHQSSPNTNLCYNQLHSFLLNQMFSGREIQLQDFAGEKLQHEKPLPNTLSLMFRFWEQQVVVISNGGATANSLLGRFTALGGAYEELGREIAAMEQSANPECLFFDIAYQAEQHVDNVNRRRVLYGLELPILSWPGTNHLLDFNDIQVSLQGGEVILFSKKYQKRLIPRIASAYNYTRSDLSAYRFLCDLQHQGVATDLNFDLRSIFPGLDHYPRVSYGNIILSPAKWRIPQEFTSAYKDGALGQKLDALQVWLHKNRISSRVLVGDSDSTLCLDSTSETDLKGLLYYCRQKVGTTQYLSEALIDEKAQVSDQHGKPYAAQFVCNYSHEKEIYPSVKFPSEEIGATPHQAILPPGSEWIYYELYCYPTKSDQFLSAQIATFLKMEEQYISKWFFIRYNDPSPHLRLRLQLKEPSLSHRVTLALKKLVEPYLYSGQLIDFRIASYRRELLRYGAERIDRVEQYFHLDSEHALWTIGRSISTDELYSCALGFIAQVFLPYFGSINEQLRFVEKIAHQFATESNLGPSGFASLNQAFKKFTKAVPTKTNVKNSATLAAFKRQLESVFLGTDDQTRATLIGDFVHMHINRLFSADQRLHETVIYHYLRRQLLALRAQQAVGAEHGR